MKYAFYGILLMFCFVTLMQLSGCATEQTKEYTPPYCEKCFKTLEIHTA